MELDELKTMIYSSGVIGAGGAGFPTHAKLCRGIDTVILNCCECEPLQRGDRQLLARYTNEILKALSIVIEALDAERGIIAVKSSYNGAINAVREKIGRYNEFGVELKIMKDVYPVGDEIVLVYETTGKIVPEGAVPLSVGTVVINTETALNIYNSVFMNKPVTEKYVTITGAVDKPVTIKAPVGTAIYRLIECAGVESMENYDIIIGGPMTGKLGSIYSTVTKTTNCVIVLPQSHPIVQKRQEKNSHNLKRVMSVCSQCSICTDLCPRHLLGHSIKPHKIMNALSNGLFCDIEAFTSSMYCSECGLCEMYSCSQGLSPRSLIGELKSRLKQEGIKSSSSDIPCKADSMREYRKVPMERLVARLSLTQYNLDAPIIDMPVNVQRVEILLNQHIGAAAYPVVKAGDAVKKGQLLGDVEDGKLGARVHSSIDGIVTCIEENVITIEAGETIG